MKFLLDIFFFLLFLLIVIINTERGFVNSVWSTVTIIGAFIIAYMFSSAIGDWICQNFVLNYVSEYAYEVLERMLQNNTEQYNISSLFQSLPDEFLSLVENCGADLSNLEATFGSSIGLSETEVYSFAEAVALPLSKTLSNAIAIVAVFLISIILLWAIGLIVKIIVKIPVIKTLNSFLGFLVGLIKGFIIVWILCITLSIFVERGFMNPESVQTLNNLVIDSYVFNFFDSFSLTILFNF